MPYKNPELTKIHQREYYLAHKAERSQKAKAYYYLKHRDEVLTRSKNRYKTHRDEILEQSRQYYASHRTEKDAINKEWVLTHPNENKEIKKRCRNKRKHKSAIYNKKHRRENRGHYLVYRKQWRVNNPDKVKEDKLRSRFGITIIDFNNMLQGQNNKCGICHNVFDKIPCVDHCHKTGIVRGLLCRGCNSGMGGFKDDPTLLERAITWLKGEIHQNSISHQINLIPVLRNNKIFEKYGMTQEDFSKLYTKQNGRCGICLTEFKQDHLDHLNIDHCHITEKVRGLLCGRCNRSLGLLKDNILIISESIKWLKKGAQA